MKIIINHNVSDFVFPIFFDRAFVILELILKKSYISIVIGHTLLPEKRFSGRFVNTMG
jgi:hypothetical protein